jgi:hypothetical protein
MKIFSENGQAEWILQLLNGLGIDKGVVFEAGAHRPDSISCSRCFIEHGYSAILVERDESFVKLWRQQGFPNVEILKQSIEYNSSGLDKLLYEVNAPADLDVLFLDIDGGELQLVAGLSRFHPKIICIEYDNSFPLSIDYVPRQITHGRQASSTATYKELVRSGYTYLKSFWHDHVFISNDFVTENRFKFEFETGADSFLSNATSHLYNPIAVVSGQSEENGGKGVDFLASKVNILMTEEHNYAKHYFFHTLHTLLVAEPLVKRDRSGRYYSDFIDSLNRFKANFSKLLFWA